MDRKSISRSFHDELSSNACTYNANTVDQHITLLAASPLKVLEALITCVHDFENDDRGADFYPSLGVTRQELIHQINLELLRRQKSGGL